MCSRDACKDAPVEQRKDGGCCVRYWTQYQKQKMILGLVSLEDIYLTRELAACRPALPRSWEAVLVSMVYPRAESSPKSLK